MSIKSSLLVVTATLAAGMTFATLHSARAHTLDSDIQNDISAIHREHRTVEADEARLARERAEQAAARAREQADLRSGHFGRAVQDYRMARKDERETAAAQRQLQADREKLAHDRRDIRHDIRHDD